MSSKFVFYFAIFISILWPFSLNAYELATHARITEKVYERSVLVANPSLLDELGLSDETSPFGEEFYDISGSEVRIRRQNDFEKIFMPNTEEKLTIKGWLMRGAIREDDHKDIEVCNYYSANPDEDDSYLVSRPLNHFYDPVKDKPLNGFFGLLNLGKKAPDWALGTSDFISAPNIPDASRKNHYSLFDAREAMWRALTGTDKSGSTNIKPSGSTATDEEARKAYWATVFRALGNVAHLIEDIANPQHTRNDPHAGVCGSIFTGKESAYEKYIDEKAIAGALNYGGYKVPVFNKYSDFFTTAPGGNVITGKGLADYSNRSFFTEGTNIGTYRYDYPSNNRADFTPIIIENNENERHAYLTGTVLDTYATSESGIDVKLSHETLFKRLLDEETDLSSEPYKYSLNTKIYDEMAKYLMPRAVSYSAGLIDYFFRGRLETVDPVKGGNEVDLKVKNATNYIVGGVNSETLYAGGKLVLTVRYTNSGTNYHIASNQVVVVQDITPGATGTALDTDGITPIPYRFTLPKSIPNSATNIEYRLVFRGQLGNESDGVAVGICEPCIQERIDLSYGLNNLNESHSRRIAYNYGYVETLTMDSSGCVDEGAYEVVSYEQTHTSNKFRGFLGYSVLFTDTAAITASTYYNVTGALHRISFPDQGFMANYTYSNDWEVESWIEVRSGGQIVQLPNTYEKLVITSSTEGFATNYAAAGHHYEYYKWYEYNWLCASCSNGLNYNARVTEKLQNDDIKGKVYSKGAYGYYDLDQRVVVKDIQVRDGVITSEIIITDITSPVSVGGIELMDEEAGGCSPYVPAAGSSRFPAEGGTLTSSGEASEFASIVLINDITGPGVCPLE